MTPSPQSADDDVALRKHFQGVYNRLHSFGLPDTAEDFAISQIEQLRPHLTYARTSPPADAPAQGKSSERLALSCMRQQIMNEAIRTNGDASKHPFWYMICEALEPAHPVLNLTSQPAPAQPVNAMLLEALNHAILFLESSLQGQLGAFVNAMREEELPYLRNVALTAAQQPGADNSRDLLSLIADCRDALNAGLPYMEGSTFTMTYARRQVKETAERCQTALDAQQPGAGVGGREKQLESVLINAGQILNAVRARYGTTCGYSETYFKDLVEKIRALLGGDILQAQWNRDFPTPKPIAGEGWDVTVTERYSPATPSPRNSHDKI